MREAVRVGAQRLTSCASRSRDVSPGGNWRSPARPATALRCLARPTAAVSALVAISTPSSPCGYPSVRALAAANILIQRNNVAKIADFGISKQLKRPQKAQALGKLPAGVDHQRLTSGNRVQTLPFRAPEVFLGET